MSYALKELFIKVDTIVFQHGLEKRTGQTCKVMMKRFRDTSGTFKLVSMVGMEKLGKAMGKFWWQSMNKPVWLVNLY